MEISFSFGIGFVQRSHKPLDCWGYESKTQLGETNHGIIKLCGFKKRIGGPRLSSWIFHLGF